MVAEPERIKEPPKISGEDISITYGKESRISISEDRVLKAHDQRYFDTIRKYRLKGEYHYLHENRCPSLVKYLAGWDGGLWLEKLDFPLGTAQGVSAKALSHLEGTPAKKIEDTLDVVCDDLAEAGLIHHDLHPGNLLWCEQERRFKAIDVTYMTDASSGLRVEEVINPIYSTDDATAIERMKENIGLIPTLHVMVSSLATDVPGSNTRKNELYHPIPFPEFDTIPVRNRAATEDTYSHVSKHVQRRVKPDTENSILLDLGCSHGYYLFRLAQYFGWCIGIDQDRSVLELNDRIREAKQFHKICFFNRLLPDVSGSVIGDGVDVVLMLNVHQWLWNSVGKDDCSRFLSWLSWRSKWMYFQTAHLASSGKVTVPLGSESAIRTHLANCGWNSQKLNYDKKRKRYLFVCRSRSWKPKR